VIERRIAKQKSQKASHVTRQMQFSSQQMLMMVDNIDIIHALF
jgi:hypothetical protein